MNSFIELYNGCGVVVDAGDYALLLCRDGCEQASPHSAGRWTGSLEALIPSGQRLGPGVSYVITYCEQQFSAHCADPTLV